jgi:cytochrome P450
VKPLSAEAAAPTSELDPFSPEFRADPYPRYAQLRALGPVVWLTAHGIWAVTDDAHVRAALSDHANFSNAGGGGLANYFVVPPWRPPSIILEVDPPQHERTRGVLMRVFSPAALRAMRAEFELQATRLVEAALAQGEIEAIGDLVQPFPLKVFGDAVGLAAEERDKLLVYGSMVFGAFGPPTEWYRTLMRQAPQIGDWIDQRCRRAALAPGGLGMRIYEFADRGTITEQEALLLVRSLLSAGVDTTIDSIGLAVRALAEHPDEWAKLRAEPKLALAAFEEATRYDSSSQSLFRTMLADLPFGGVTLRRHQKVLVLLGAAARDPARWAEPDRFDISRRAIGHLGYGTGIHACVAQMMARLEGEVFLQVLARRVAVLRATGPAVQRLTPGLRGLSSLPLRVEAA